MYYLSIDIGKTMENLRKRVNVKLLSKWNGRYGAEAYISKPEFKNFVIFNENLVAVELRKLEIFLNKPIYAGQVILDLAKTTIYNFHYGYMTSTFEEFTLLYTDTDSLIYEIRNQDPYIAIKNDCYTYFDTSDYPQPNVYEIPPINKKVLGLMKDENSGVLMTDYVGLRSKLYATRVMQTNADIMKKRKRLHEEGYDENEIIEIVENLDILKKAKGVKSSVVKTEIHFSDYINCLESSKSKVVNQNLIRSSKHQVHSITQQKVALSAHDDKRFLIPNSYETLPWGHCLINNM